MLIIPRIPVHCSETHDLYVMKVIPLHYIPYYTVLPPDRSRTAPSTVTFTFTPANSATQRPKSLT